jgi:hypothetical protein
LVLLKPARQANITQGGLQKAKRGLKRLEAHEENYESSSIGLQESQDFAADTGGL